MRDALGNVVGAFDHPDCKLPNSKFEGARLLVIAQGKFHFFTLESGDYKVKVENSNQLFFDQLDNTKGVEILTDEEFDAMK